MELVVDGEGILRHVYDERFDWGELGRVSIRRASHVEPTMNGDWQADLAPVEGPVLGPFPRRSEALTAERRWLEIWLSGARWD